MLVAVLFALELVLQDQAQFVFRNALDREQAAALDEGVGFLLEFLLERDITLFLLDERVIVEAFDCFFDVALPAVDEQAPDFFQIEMLALDCVGHDYGERD